MLAGVALVTLIACSTSYWYNPFQGLQYDKCEKLADAQERRRCKSETRPDEDRYAKERAASIAAPRRSIVSHLPGCGRCAPVTFDDWTGTRCAP